MCTTCKVLSLIFGVDVNEFDDCNVSCNCKKTRCTTLSGARNHRLDSLIDTFIGVAGQTSNRHRTDRMGTSKIHIEIVWEDVRNGS